MLTFLLRLKRSLSIRDPTRVTRGENAFGPLWGKKGKKNVAVEMDSSIFHEQGHLSVTGKSPSSLHQFNKDSK